MISISVSKIKKSFLLLEWKKAFKSFKYGFLLVLFLKKVFDVGIMYDLLLKQVGTALSGFYQLNAFGEILSGACFQCCNNLLCHDLLFYLPVKGYLFQNRVIFFSFQPVRSIFTVLCGNVP